MQIWEPWLQRHLLEERRRSPKAPSVVRAALSGCSAPGKATHGHQRADTPLRGPEV